MNKVIHVPAYFEPIFENKKVKVGTGETKKTLFGGEKEITRKEIKRVQTGWSESFIDTVRLANDLEYEVGKLNNEGYEVVSVTPITSGTYAYKYDVSSGGRDNHGYGGYGYGYGYSFTASLIVTAKKINKDNI
ncbi:hypothetical protein [Pseudoalteromonas sp. 68 DY56-GL68]|uniref:hypothetical protein n=1 Tax=Pseudoalteromonas sp. 68 DY56-GL68 TaxID=2974919 RepID=UPI00352B0F89